MRPLRVRAYNVEFGDAILISIPEKKSSGDWIRRHILIDVGNRGTKDDNRHFRPVLEDILKELDGEPLDLYIMTHEHLDHVQGLPFAEKKIYKKEDYELRKALNPKYAWFPVSSREGYFDEPSHILAKQKMQLIRTTLIEIDSYLNAIKETGQNISPHLETLWAINNIGRTSDCVKYLKTFTPQCFVHRGKPLDGCPPFKDAKLTIWAPEEDIGLYLSTFSPQLMHLEDIRTPQDPHKISELAPVFPPPGVDAGAFYDLDSYRQRFYENLLAANSAINNTSIVFCLEWYEFRLLFTGDAEEQSWKIMQQNEVLQDVQFLKISHHGSHNGTPEPEILDTLLPPDDKQGRFALLSTAEGPYETIPDEETLKLIEERVERLHQLHKERDPGKHLDIYFQPKEDDEQD